MSSTKGSKSSTPKYSASAGHSSGTNSAGNHYCTRGDSKASGGAYHYSNSNGSYYYQNTNGSTYYSNPSTGFSKYTSSTGQVTVKK